MSLFCVCIIALPLGTNCLRGNKTQLKSDVSQDVLPFFFSFFTASCDVHGATKFAARSLLVEFFLNSFVKSIFRTRGIIKLYNYCTWLVLPGGIIKAYKVLFRGGNSRFNCTCSIPLSAGSSKLSAEKPENISCVILPSIISSR